MICTLNIFVLLNHLFSLINYWFSLNIYLHVGITDHLIFKLLAFETQLANSKNQNPPLYLLPQRERDFICLQLSLNNVQAMWLPSPGPKRVFKKLEEKKMYMYTRIES